VPWVTASGEFKCPCHGSIYNVIGEYQSGPAPRGMDRFPIVIENDHVMVDTSTIVEGPPPGTHDGPSQGGSSGLAT
jgi:cytochrome b6-f complex iron-sulfur subunit